ncbi:hypothetical protein [Brachybacterium sp. GPGPB12]|uniref:hypothetical protein n=1 Tax=Brachybacterium sp. GPGPB12 TaxID=3023517 RepID=UPI0031345136
MPSGFTEAEMMNRMGNTAKATARMPTTWRHPTSAIQRPKGIRPRAVTEVCCEVCVLMIGPPLS